MSCPEFVYSRRCVQCTGPRRYSLLSCPELVYSLRYAKAWDRIEKIGLSYPELVYSHRCVRIAGPPRNFLTCLDQVSPVLESGDRSSSLVLFPGTCVFSSVCASAGTSREACFMLCPELVYSRWCVQSTAETRFSSHLVRNLYILFGARKSVVPSCENWLVLSGTYSHRCARGAGPSEKLNGFVLSEIRRCSNRGTGRVS